MKNSIDTTYPTHEEIIARSLKFFKREFITLRDNETGLNLQLEICIDSQNKLYVRHYTLYIIYGFDLKIINSQDNNLIDDCLSTIHEKCQKLRDVSIKWLEYKLNSENIFIMEKDIKIETPAIMLPFNLFVDLVEYMWLTDSDLPKILEEQEKSWYKNQAMSTKIAKWLDDNNANLRKLVEVTE